MKSEVKAATAVLDERARLVEAHSKVLAELDGAGAAIELADRALTQARVEARLGQREEVPPALHVAAQEARQTVVALTAEAAEISRRLDDLDAKLEASGEALRMAALVTVGDAASRLVDAKEKAIGPLATALRKYRIVLSLAAIEATPDLNAVFRALVDLGVEPEALTPTAADDAVIHEATQLRVELQSALRESMERRRAEALRVRRQGELAK